MLNALQQVAAAEPKLSSKCFHISTSSASTSPEISRALHAPCRWMLAYTPRLHSAHSRSRWHTLFPPLILRMCVYTYHTLAGTQASAHLYTLCPYHTKAANLNWNVYVVLKRRFHVDVWPWWERPGCCCFFSQRIVLLNSCRFGWFRTDGMYMWVCSAARMCGWVNVSQTEWGRRRA